MCVWNRNTDRTAPLNEAGAQVAISPRTASKDADFVMCMLRDDKASRSVWCDDKNGALAGMKPGAVAIDCSTLTVDWVRELNQNCIDKNIVFLDAPVAGSRPQAEAAQLTFFVSGNKIAFQQVKLILNAIGNMVLYAGSSGAGTSIKLAVNALFGIQLAAMGELVGFLKATGLDVNHALEILTSTPVCSPAAKVAAFTMLAEVFTPMFPIDLVEKDFRYAVTTAKENHVSTPMTLAALSVFQKAVEKGFGEDNITGVAQLYF